MNVFVAGIHGVGKTFLASRAAAPVNMLHTSASTLIQQERRLSTWTSDKKVSEIALNQRALIAAVRRHNEAGTKLLLDGHFVLRDPTGNLLPIETVVFSRLALSKTVLIEASIQTIAQRISARDQQASSLDDLEALVNAERQQAQKVCMELAIPLVILESPSQAELIAAITN